MAVFILNNVLQEVKNRNNMAWDPKYLAFRVIKIDKDKVHLYSSRDSYHTLTIGKPIVSAVRAGGFLNVTLADSKVRRYSSRDNYSTM